MWKIVFISVVASGLLVLGAQDNSICDGVFKVTNVEKCENPEKYSYDFEIQKRKINRTHDGFNLKGVLPGDFTAAIAVRLETYMKCDGGYKASDVVGPTSACTMLEEYAKEMFEKALTMAGVNPPTCPLPKGPLELQDLVLDYSTLPTRAKCGDAKTKVTLLDGVFEVGCITIYTTFTERDGDEDDED